MTATVPSWQLHGTGFEFCNCQPGCTCNFSGFPTSPDGSCKAAVLTRIEAGHCGDVDLSGIDAVGLFDWPKAIHDGNGHAVFVVPPEVSDAQLGALAQIFTGQFGGMPWAILGGTYAVDGVVRARIDVTDDDLDSGFAIPGVGQARGTTLKNPVTGEDHRVAIDLDQGFIWKRGDCGQGSFDMATESLSLQFKDSNWIRYRFDWRNDR